ncbi:Xaa-Pro peptidase family protein [Homoserinibacter sp. GY 40078]|uniref:M24 family metallopeptidase n=1 Tax=Homoserinibacter sp. GY 40078 TaxID=2603275 RepID=UPI0011C78B4F|nr:Xaa-Pro peptidase family protein [Homoserinibacter sp. GY 40078]TXK19846.1 aminopeptidase P family protein [Homoserinibacter sp. GY 40078]
MTTVQPTADPLVAPFDFAARRARLWEALDERGVDVLFLPADQSDFEWVTGVPRRAPSFGNIAYTNHWISGAFVAPGEMPLFVLTRHFQEFDLPDGVDGEVVTAIETDDGREVFRSAFDQYRSRRVAVSGPPRAEACEHEGGAGERIAVTGRTWSEVVVELRAHRPEADLVIADDILSGLRAIKDPQEIALMRASAAVVDRVMAEVAPHVVPGITEIELASEVDLQMRRHGSSGASFDTGVWGMGPALTRDASVRVSTDALAAGTGVSFDFGAITRGYCSDFGRTVHIGDPSEEYERVHEVVMAAQEAGRRTAVPGATGGDVHRAAREVIDDAGYGDWFRHRVGHCIGLDVHELPFLSAEDETPLAPGMLFTIEPSVFWPGRVGVRVEDVFLMTESGAVSINDHHRDLIAN